MKKRIAALKSRIKSAAKRYLYSDYVMTMRQYKYINGFYPDLRDPKNLSEKVSWLKLHDRSALHTLCADKIRAREYVAARLGPDLLIPTILVTYDPGEVAPAAIHAARFVVKTNHDQGGVFICRDRDAFDWEAARAEVGARLKVNKYPEFRERQYRDIRPGVLVETLVEGDGGGAPVDVKINCCNGAPVFLQIDVDRLGSRRRVFYYDPEWRRLPMRGRSAPCGEGPPRPASLGRMLRAAALLAEPFPFVRIDFLLGAGDRPWFGEITFHPAAGLVRYDPPEVERALGDAVDLSRLGEARALQRRILAEGLRGATGA